MSILDVTEDQIFHTLGKGRDPNFKPIEKVRPIIAKPKKTYTLNHPVKTAPALKITQPQVVETVSVAPIIDHSTEVDESMKKLTEELYVLNNRVSGIQKMVKWYLMPQFVVVLALLLALIVKS